MAFKTVKIIGDGSYTAAIMNSFNTESVLHSCRVYNTTGGDLNFILAIDGVDLITETVQANTGYSLPDKLNIPVNTVLTASGPIGIIIIISFYEQAIDTEAANTVLQDTVDNQKTYLDDIVNRTEAAEASISPHYGAMTTVVNNIGVIQTAEQNAIDAAASNVTAYSNATLAMATANNKGDWGVLTGVMNIPASVNHNSSIWVLNTNLGDITSSEPQIGNSDWTQFVGERINDYDGGNAYEVYSSADIILESGGI